MRIPVRAFLTQLSVYDNIAAMADRDPNLDTLLLLDGERFVIDASRGYWVKVVVKRVPVTVERPHGLRYSLSLHDASGNRLLGFDNAHPVREGTGPGARTRIELDHRHTRQTVRFYVYEDAAALLQDFWAEVEKYLEM